MKLVLVQGTVYVPTHGGENKANRCLLEELAQRGHSCQVVAPASGAQGPDSREAFRRELHARGLELVSTSPAVDVFRQRGVEIHAVHDPSRLRAYARDEIRRAEPDCVLVSSEDPGQVLLGAALETRTAPVVYLAHTALFFPFGPHAFLPTPSGTELVKSAAAIITVSRYLGDYIHRNTGCEPAVLAFPVYGHYGQGAVARREALGSGFATLINPCTYKGLPIFLELARRLPDIPFAAVPSWGTTRADRAALEQLSNVTILPAVDDIDEIFGRTRIVLMPSLWAEGFPLTPVEAMLRGIPVVASDSGGLPEAMLGVDHVLPVRPIARYEQRLDERGLPIAIVGEQVIESWVESLERLSERTRYEHLAAAAHAAATAFASSVSVAPFEDHLARVAGRTASRPPAISTAPAGGEAAPQDLREQLRSLSPERLAVLAQKLQTRRAGAGTANELSAAPLSVHQEGVWFAEQLRPGSAQYNMAFGLSLTGRLDVSALGRSLDEVVRRHDSLRARFAEQEGTPVQRVEPAVAAALPVTDLGDRPTAQRWTTALQLANEDAQRPLDLETGPLFRTRLLQVEEQRHLLVLVVHHIAFDGWSLGVVFRELEACYRAFATGAPLELPDLAMQYADYARWQREWVRTPAAAEQRAYWKQQLEDAPPVLELPADHVHPAVPTVRGTYLERPLPQTLAAAVRALSSRAGVTPYMTLLAAFEAMLHRYTGVDDLVVGSPVATRTRAGTEGLVGLLVNNIVLRTDVSGDPTFRQLLARVREVVTRGYANHALPFENLVEELHAPRSMGRAPLAQVMFAMQGERRVPELPGLDARLVDLDTGTSKYDLSLHLFEQDGGLRCRAEYSTELFEAGTVERLLGHYELLLEGAVADPDRPVSALPLLTEPERRQLLVEWNETAVDYPRGCVHELFEAQVERTPDAVAVGFDGEQLTYRELNRRANRLAHFLRARGVGPEVLVGLCLERSLELVVSLVAVLKAGGAYVPVDAGYPAERISFVLEDAAVAVLVTEGQVAERLSESTRQAREIVCIDSDAPAISLCSDANPRSGAGPRSLAYVIYTSGSTGKPKGVLITHANVARLFAATESDLRFDHSDVWTLFHSVAFDFSVWELWGALLFGGRLVVVPDSVLRSPDTFYELIVAERVTVLNQTPSAFRQLMQADEKQVRGGLALRLVIFGGEALDPRSLRGWVSRHGDRRPRLINMYGITETTVHVTLRPVTAADVHGDRGSLIGRPLPDLTLHILDAHLQPVPIGVPGELHVGGAGLARGYLGQPALTAERFIADPFSAEQGARLYRTGDRARRLGDGDIEYLGRLDEQVKIRGYRIELGEIEATLDEHACVRQSAVAVRERAADDRRLVAWYVPARQPPPPTDELRDHLGRTLPDHMLPTSYVPLDELPLTPNGKIDRRALLDVDVSATDLVAKELVLPRDPVEEVLADIWREVLGTPRIGVHDDFFELGGHSLLATQVVSRTRERFRIELPFRSIFESPTVEGLAQQVREATEARIGEPPSQIVSRPRVRHKLAPPS